MSGAGPDSTQDLDAGEDWAGRSPRWPWIVGFTLSLVGLGVAGYLFLRSQPPPGGPRIGE